MRHRRIYVMGECKSKENVRDRIMYVIEDCKS